MKVLAFTDLHSSKSALKKIKQKIKKHKPDFILCAGDSTYFGDDLDKALKDINSLSAPVMILPGNPPHETSKDVRKHCKKYSNITYAHKKILKLGEYTLVGHGGGGFYGPEELDTDFEKFIKKNKAKLKGDIILLTHAPPYKTKLDYLDWFEEHVGCISYKKFIKEYKPVLAISGHIHETFGQKQKIGKTLIYNTGPQGRVFELTKKNVKVLK